MYLLIVKGASLKQVKVVKSTWEMFHKINNDLMTVRLCRVTYVIVRVCFVFCVNVYFLGGGGLFAVLVSRQAMKYVKLGLSLHSVWCSFEFQFTYCLYSITIFR